MDDRETDKDRESIPWSDMRWEDDDEEDKSLSQPCNPRQGDVSQTVGKGGGNMVHRERYGEYNSG